MSKQNKNCQFAEERRVIWRENIWFIEEMFDLSIIISAIEIKMWMEQDRRKVWKCGGASCNVMGIICLSWLR